MNAAPSQSPLRARLRRPHGAHALRLPDDSHHRQHLRGEGRRAARPGARAGDRLRRRHRRHVRRARDGVRAARDGRSGPSWPTPGSSSRWRCSSSPWALSMFGAFEVALPSGLQERLSRVGGRGFVGAFVMGLVAGIIAAPCTGPPLASLLAYVATTRNADLGVRAARDLRRRRRAAVLAAGRVLDVAAAPRALDGVGEERLRHRALRGRALLPQERRAALAHFGSGTPRFALTMAALVLVGVGLGAVHASFHGGAGASACARRSPSALATVGLFGATNYLLAPKGDVELRLARRRAGAPSPRRARPAARCWSTSPPAGASPAASSR